LHGSSDFETNLAQKFKWKPAKYSRRGQFRQPPVSEVGAGGFGFFVFGDETEGEGGHGFIV